MREECQTFGFDIIKRLASCVWRAARQRAELRRGRETFVHNRIGQRSPGARVVLGNGGKKLESIGLRGWASIEGEAQLDLIDPCGRVFGRYERGHGGCLVHGARDGAHVTWERRLPLPQHT